MPPLTTQGELESLEVSVVHSTVLLAISYTLHCTSFVVWLFVPVVASEVFTLFFCEYVELSPHDCKNNVAVSHAAKKLVRLIYHLEKTGQLYKTV